MEHVGNTDEWYNPGTVDTLSNVVTNDSPEIRYGPVSNKVSSLVPTCSQRDLTICRDEGVKVDQPYMLSTAVPGDEAVVPSKRSAQQPITERSRRSAKRQRKRQKLCKGSTFPNQLANDTDGPRPSDVATPCHEQPLASIPGPLVNVPNSHPKLPQNNEPTNGEASTREPFLRENSHGNVIAITEEHAIPALRLKAGFRTQRVRQSMTILLLINRFLC